jgi:hypothetical protein
MAGTGRGRRRGWRGAEQRLHRATARYGSRDCRAAGRGRRRCWRGAERHAPPMRCSGHTPARSGERGGHARREARCRGAERQGPQDALPGAPRASASQLHLRMRPMRRARASAAHALREEHRGRERRRGWHGAEPVALVGHRRLYCPILLLPVARTRYDRFHRETCLGHARKILGRHRTARVAEAAPFR